MKAYQLLARCVAATLALSPIFSTPLNVSTASIEMPTVNVSPSVNCGTESTEALGTGALQGRVLDGATAQAVPNVKVILCITSAGGTIASPTYVIATTDAEGRYGFANLPRAEICPPNTKVGCSYQYFTLITLGTEIRSDYETNETSWDGVPGKPLDILLHKGANISGSMTDFIAGHAVNDAIMVVANRRNQNGPPLLNSPADLGTLTGAVFTTTLTPSGTFMLTNLPTGAFDVYALPLNLNYSSAALGNVQAQRPFTTAGVDFVLKRTARLIGRVRNSRGDAVPNVSMLLISDNASEPATGAWVSGSGGVFDYRSRAREAPQRLVVSGTYPYLGQIVEQPVAFEVGTKTELTITVYEPGIIRGTLLYRSGKPALNHAIDLIDPSGRFTSGTAGCDTNTITDGSGRFTLCGIHPADGYLLSARRLPGICAKTCAPFIVGYFGGIQRADAKPIVVVERQITSDVTITVADPIYLPVVGGLAVPAPIP
jgi:hypothetical protein